MARRKVSPAAADEIAALRERGWSHRRIADRCGISAGAVNYHCLKLGARSPRSIGRATQVGKMAIMRRDGRMQRRFTAAEDAEMVRLSLSGMSVLGIAKQMCRARTSVCMRLMALALHDETEAA